MFRRPISQRIIVLAALLSSTLIVATGNSTAYALDGDRDMAFGNAGFATTAPATTDNALADIAIQSDGKIVSGGSSPLPGTGYDFALTRHNSDGTLDTSFDGDGIVTTDVSTGRVDNLSSIALQSDGKIVAAGWSSNGSRDLFSVVRYNTDGSLDTSFDADGKLLIDAYTGASNSNASKVLVQSDGKIIVMGSTLEPNNQFHQPAITRLASNGAIDFQTVVPTTSTAMANSGVVQSDGKILVVGFQENTVGYGSMWRLNSNGNVDSGFGQSGQVVSSLRGSYSTIALQSDNKIVVAGYNAEQGQWNNSLVARFLANGSTDNTFASGGTFVNSFVTNSDDVTDLLIQGDGKIVISGYATVSSTNRGVIARLTTQGALDTTFSSDGYEIITVGSSIPFAYFVAQQSNNKIVMGASGIFNSKLQFTLLRFDVASSDSSLAALSLSHGSLSPSFTSGTTSYTSSVDNDVSSLSITATLSEPNATLLINGSTTASATASASIPLTVGVNNIPIAVTSHDASTTTNYTVVVTRAAGDGDLDPSFGVGGIKTTDFGNAADYAVANVIQPDGKIIVAGDSSPDRVSDSVQFSVARYHPDGSPDLSFNSDGKTTTTFASNRAVAIDVAMQSDGKILVAGWVEQNATPSIAVARYNTDGSPDLSFSDDGKDVFLSAPDQTREEAASVLVQPDGKIVLIVFSQNVMSNTARVVRLNPDGSRDQTFGTSGVAIISLATNLYARAGALQTDGKIVVTGYTFAVTSKSFVSRLNANGSVDDSFGTNGNIYLDPTSGEDKVRSLTVLPNGKIVVAGDSYDVGPDTERGFVAQIMSNGSLDPMFGVAGVARPIADAFTMRFRAISAQSDSKLIILGNVIQSDGDNSILITVRLKSDGSLDSTFSDDGMAVLSEAGYDIYGRGVSIQSENSLVISGFRSNQNISDFYTVQLKATSSLSTLSGLSLNSGALNEAFSSAVRTYTAAVSNSVSSITVTPTAGDRNATLTVNGTTVPTGTASGFLNLSVGANTVSIVVTSQNGTASTTYTLTVTRAQASTPTNNQVASAPVVSTAPVVATAPLTTSPVASPVVALAYPTVRVKKTITAKAILASRSITFASTSKVAITIKASSKKFCSARGSKVTGLKKGNCTVVVAVTPKATAKVKKPKTTKTTVTIRVI